MYSLKPARGRTGALRVSRASILPRAQQTSEAATKADGVSSYEDTSNFVKQLVSGLTAIVNFVIPAASERVDDAKPAISPQDVFEGVQGDFTDRCYLWTGEVSTEIYAEHCTFTDPTLSFQGLQTFQRNLASLKPVLDRILSFKAVDLLDCQLLEDEQAVVARWRMTGQFRFPWTPVLDLTGRTRFSYDPAIGNLVVQYHETWDVSASDALLQLLKPHAKLMQ